MGLLSCGTWRRFTAVCCLTASSVVGAQTMRLDASSEVTAKGVAPDGNIVVTDVGLNVLTRSAPRYRCNRVRLEQWGIRYEVCYLLADSSIVYEKVNSAPPSFAPGYSMTAGGALIVDAAHFGRGSI